ncbi:MAG: hypothetical protein J6Y37_02190 [Paludibacteraceae bacterium]|nr:hypothetical protein [Paludibacteraceae bacterium]
MAKYDWSKDRVEQAVKNSFSYNDTLRNLEIKVSGNNGETLKRKIKIYGIDTSHFTFHSPYQAPAVKNVYEYLLKGKYVKTATLKEKLIAAGLKTNKCEKCGISSWQGEPIVCQLHHINGDNTDNRLENLQMLCPNCHSQTDNYCGQANKKTNGPRYCKDCGRELKSSNSEYCLSCASRRRKKITLSDEEFSKILKECGYNKSETARRLGVSETAIRKKCKNLE